MLQADRLVRVNNNSLVDADHHRAVDVLKATGLRIEIVVQRTGESERRASANVLQEPLVSIRLFYCLRHKIAVCQYLLQ